MYPKFLLICESYRDGRNWLDEQKISLNFARIVTQPTQLRGYQDSKYIIVGLNPRFVDEILDLLRCGSFESMEHSDILTYKELSNAR